MSRRLGRRPLREEDENLTHQPPEHDQPAHAGPHAVMRGLQQTAGNQAVNQMLDTPAASADDPVAVQQRLGEGRPLDPGTRARMESTFGQSFADVQLHTDGDAASLAGQMDARAFTVGEHIAFDSGEYRPGTLIGDALIAHELAHVTQQAGATTAEHASRSPALEQDANRSTVGAVLGGLARGGRALAAAGPRLTSGLSLQRCTRSEKYEAPDYFGPHSRETVDIINNEIESWDLVGDLIVGGTALTLATSAPEETLASGGYDIEPQARALAAIPQIKRLRIMQHIQILIVMHGNDLNDQERQFWNNALRVLERAGQIQSRSESQQSE